MEVGGQGDIALDDYNGVKWFGRFGEWDDIQREDSGGERGGCGGGVGRDERDATNGSGGTGDYRDYAGECATVGGVHCAGIEWWRGDYGL